MKWQIEKLFNKKLIFGIITGAIAIIAIYLSIFWVEWMLVFGIIVFIGRIIIKSWYRNTFLWFIKICLIVYLLFPLHLIFAVYSFSTTLELARDLFSGQLSCNNQKMRCNSYNNECGYENTRNCIWTAPHNLDNYQRDKVAG